MHCLSANNQNIQDVGEPSKPLSMKRNKHHSEKPKHKHFPHFIYSTWGYRFVHRVFNLEANKLQWTLERKSLLLSYPISSYYLLHLFSSTYHTNLPNICQQFWYENNQATLYIILRPAMIIIAGRKRSRHV